jgi:uncharacterized alkaline shock family protein YloU
VTSPGLAVARRVIEDTVRAAAAEVPGVARVGRGGKFAGWFGRRPVNVHLDHGVIRSRVYVIARPGVELGPLGGQVRAGIGAGIERVLGLQASDVTVVVDGVAS